MRYFVIILVFVGFLGFILFENEAYALWIPLSPEELLEQSETIFVGTVTAITPVEVEYQSKIARNGTIKESIGPEVKILEEYTVKVEEFLQNPQGSDTMKVLRATVSGVPSGPSKISGFEIGDRVLFYLPKDEKQTHFSGQYLPESFEIPKYCDAKSVLEEPRIDGRNFFEIFQGDVLKKDNFTAGIPMKFVLGKDASTLFGASIDVDVAISKAGENQVLFQKTIHAESEPCQWITATEWEFTPEGGDHKLYLSVRENNETGRTTLYTGFSVVADTEKQKPLKLDDFASKLWYEHDYIIGGTILDIRGYGQPERVYDIQINSFFKPEENPGTKVITVYGSPNFYTVVGDSGIFFIKKQDAKWVFGEYGATVTSECSPEVMYHSPKLIDPPLYRGYHGPDFSKVDCAPHYYRKYLPEYMKAYGASVFSPLTQQVDGVPPNEVVCNEGLELILKHNGRATCVKPETKQKLIQRGWIAPPPNNGTGIISFDPTIRPETILVVGDNAHKSSMGLEMIPEKEYTIREDRRKPWPPNPILEIAEKDLHPKVKAMLEEMWNLEGYTVSEYDKNVLGKTVNLNSTEWDHQSIYDWLKENHKKQFGGNVDAGFTNYFRYDGRIYSLSWAIAD